MKKMLITLVALALLAALTAAPVSAHVTVTSRTPAKGGTAKVTIKNARVVFSAAVRSGTLKIYKRSNGAKVSIGNGRRDPRNFRRVVTRFQNGLSAGGYVARWTVVGADGHSQSGRWRFRLVN